MLRNVEQIVIQDRDGGLKFSHNTLLTEHIKTYLGFFFKISVFLRAKKSNYRNFKVCTVTKGKQRFVKLLCHLFFIGYDKAYPILGSSMDCI